jgi:hypothetical protein
VKDNVPLLELFHPETRQVFLGVRGRRSRFGHAFGGSANYTGRVANPGQPAVHLLLRLNTSDPAVGVTLPNTRWLPIFCAIRYGACSLGYRVVSHNRVSILYQAEQTAWDGFPYFGYPASLPAEPITLKEKIYDPAKVEGIIAYAAVFGYGELSSKQHGKLIRFVEKHRFAEVTGFSSAVEWLQKGNGYPFVQGPPEDACPDPDCSNHDRKSSLRTFALFEEGPDRTRRLWGQNCGSLQIICQICPKCSAIHVSNQCT